jgi:hypothetical protein
MQRSDLRRLGLSLMALLLLAATGRTQAAPGEVLKPSTVRRGGDGVGGIEKTAGQGSATGKNSPSTSDNATLASPTEESTWADLGGELPAGGPATLAATGGTEAGAALLLEASGLAPKAPAALIIGTGVANLPFKGGTLVPAPQLMLTGFAINVHGGLVLPALLPEDLPSGLTLCLQLWSPDVTGPKGFAATNALLITLP